MKFKKTITLLSMMISSGIAFSLSPYTKLNNPNDSDDPQYSCERLSANICPSIIIKSTKTLQCVDASAVTLCEVYRERYWPQIRERWLRDSYIDNLTGLPDPNQANLPPEMRGPKSSHCSAFAHYVLNDFGHSIPPFNSNNPADYRSLANQQADFFAQNDEWVALDNMWDAQLAANQGKLVVASLLDQSTPTSAGHIGITLPNTYDTLEQFYLSGGPNVMMVGYHSYRSKNSVTGFFVHLRNHQATEETPTPDIVLANQLIKYYTPKQ